MADVGSVSAIDSFQDELTDVIDELTAAEMARDMQARASEPVTTYSYGVTVAYENTDFTREYKFSGISYAALSSIEANMLAYNAALSGAYAGDKEIFISEDGDHMTGIVGGYLKTTVETKIIDR